jgi:hypothetical protein
LHDVDTVRQNDQRTEDHSRGGTEAVVDTRDSREATQHGVRHRSLHELVETGECG